MPPAAPRKPMTASRYAVPYTDLAREAGAIKPELLRAFEAVLDSGRYILGPQLAAFEQEFAAYCGTRYAVGIASGTAALHLSLLAFGVRAGDEIITAPNSFVATTAAIALSGARPVFVDIRSDGNIDPARIERAITPRTRGVLPVHIAGRPAAMPQIVEVARRHGLFVLEDAAQSIGARLGDTRTGAFGDAACFSLNPLKNLHAFGDGGMVTTDREDIYRYLLKARSHGLADRERCDFWSFNCRLDELQAALLRVQLPHLDAWTEARRALASRYHRLLREHVEVPEEGPGEYCVYQTYVVLAGERDALQRHLNANGVEALVHYATAIHQQPAARELGYAGADLPLTCRHVGRILSLPLYPGLTHAQQDRVAERVARFYESHGARRREA